MASTLAALHSINHDAAVKAGVRVLQPSEVRQSLAHNMEQAKHLLNISETIWQR
ncbi:hypothetical protein [Chlorogloeopsis sp. ULAP02]|uniref:hypothetical protein n=1 Tax=Chlorogloeopsis sp. ULAP02 TaxID=3107926 RepID=UPI003135EC69